MTIVVSARKQKKAERLISNCKDWDILEGTQYPDATFEDGVQVALLWLLGYVDDAPEVEPPNAADLEAVSP